MKKNFKKLVSLIVMAVMVLAMAVGVMAASVDKELLDKNHAVSITITKYGIDAKKSSSDTTPIYAKDPSTGTIDDLSADLSDYTPIAGAKFVLYKIADADAVEKYYDGETTVAEYTKEKFVCEFDRVTGVVSSAKYDGNDLTIFAEGTTNSSGQLVFNTADNGLKVGIYALQEVTASEQVTVPLSEKCIISLPMVNTFNTTNNQSNNSKWLYDVNVYPKNHTSDAKVTLTKVDQSGNRVKEVEFDLYKYVKTSASDTVSATTSWGDKITTYVKKDGTTGNLTLKTTDGILKLENLPANKYGTTYKLVEAKAPEGYIVNDNPIYFTVNTDNTIVWESALNTDSTNKNLNRDVINHDNNTAADDELEITLRNEMPTFKKNVKVNPDDTKQDSTKDTDGFASYAEYRMGEDIAYRLTAYAPENVGQLETFEIIDTPTAGITDDSSTIVVKVGSETLNLTSEYTVNNNGNGFIIRFTDDGKTKIAKKEFVVTYTGYLNGDSTTIIAGEGNKNTAQLKYSKTTLPTDSDTTYSISDSANVYTYEYQIIKHKDTLTGDQIPGVDFELSDTNGILKVVNDGDGIYRLALPDERETATTTTTTLTTGSEGTILIKGLEYGKYTLKETKTIDGYNLLSGTIEINEDVLINNVVWSGKKEFTAPTNDAIIKNATTTTYGTTTTARSKDIINKKGFVLPQTGSMGYILFGIVGIALVLGGMLLLFGGKKRIAE